LDDRAATVRPCDRPAADMADEQKSKNPWNWPKLLLHEYPVLAVKECCNDAFKRF
jgi:hypothetical protein